MPSAPRSSTTCGRRIRLVRNNEGGKCTAAFSIQLNDVCLFCFLFSPAHAWYLNDNHTAPVRDVLQDVFSFLIVFNYIIPISLYVTLGTCLHKLIIPFSIALFNFSCFTEMQKFVGSLFFVWDAELRCPISGEIPICNSSDLNEELGQVSAFTLSSHIRISYSTFDLPHRRSSTFLQTRRER